MGDLIHVAGQIALVPGTMQLVEGGARKQCRLALRHVGRIVRAMDQNTQLRDVVQVRITIIVATKSKKLHGKHRDLTTFFDIWTTWIQIQKAIEIFH